MTDIEKARHLFRKNRLTFPKIPEDRAARLKERGEWLFSTREIQFSPYHILHYLREMEEICVEYYAVLCYSGQGLYYAIQYYIVHGGLAMFLFLSWGGLHRSATVSDFHFHVQREHPSAQKGFEKFIEWQLNMKGDTPNLIELGCYLKYLRPFVDAFGPQRVLVLFFEDFVRDTPAQMQLLCSQLGIDPGFYSSYNFDTHNQTISVRYNWLNSMTIKMEPLIASYRARLMRSPGAHRLFERVVSLGKSAYRSINDRGGERKASIPPDQLAYWEAYYQPFNQELAEFLQRPLPWKSFKPAPATVSDAGS